MKSQYIKELTEGSGVDSVFALCSKEMRSTRAGEAYLALEIADRTGRMAAVQFRPSADSVAVPTDAVVRLRGTVTSYRGAKRVSVDHMVPASGYDAADLMESSTRDSDEMQAEFRALAGSIQDRQLRRVLRAVFGDVAFFSRFIECPGARSHHHAYLGGLLEHTVSVASVCRMLGSVYERVDGDLLVTAALLHDIGKVDELTYDTAVGYTDEGRLLGHVVLGERRVCESVERRERTVPRHLMTRLSHAMLAHHGELEWGAPRRPSTVEALLLHHADNLDAKAAGFLAATEGASVVAERWTDASNLFRRPLWAPMPLSEGRPIPAQEDAYELVRA